MPHYLFNPPPVPSAPIRGSEALFPVNRLFFVGRNYHAHAVEMGRPVDKTVERPFYFTKAPQTFTHSGATVAYPPGTSNYHFEMELVVAIGKAGFRVQAEDAHGIIYGYAAGLDMTRRDLQLVARDKGQPWDLIYTGTPEGVGPVVASDRIAGRVQGVADVTLTIGAPA